MGELSDVNEFMEATRHVLDQTGLAVLVEAATLEMGFDWFSLVQLDMSGVHGSRGLITITNYPDDWVNELRDSMHYEGDPAYLASCRTSVGFRWDDISKLIPWATANAKC